MNTRLALTLTFGLAVIVTSLFSVPQFRPSLPVPPGPASSDPALVAATLTEIAGCYRLDIGSWERPLSDWAGRYLPPRAFRLDLTEARSPLGIPLGFMLVTPAAPHAPRPNHFPPGWQLLGLDSVLIFWGNGLGGIELRLARVHDALTGYAREFSDVFGVQAPHAPATALLIPCSVYSL